MHRGLRGGAAARPPSLWIRRW